MIHRGGRPQSRRRGGGRGRGPPRRRRENVVARGVAAGLRGRGPSVPRARASAASTASRSAAGLGSSAAAWVGGLVGGQRAARRAARSRRGSWPSRPARRAIPDNVAAAVLGGLTVSCADGAARDRGEPAGAARAPLGGAGARDRELHARGAGGAARLGAAGGRGLQRPAREPPARGLASGRIDLLSTAMQDRLHQPYRLRLFPWMDAVAAAAREAGALGCVLSGAGPSMLAACAVAGRRGGAGDGADPGGRRGSRARARARGRLDGVRCAHREARDLTHCRARRYDDA